MSELLSLALVTGYIGYILHKFGIPHSLSATYYLLEQQWVFSFILSLSAILLLPAMFSLSWQFLAFLSLAGILFVAITPEFRDDTLTELVHTSSAVIALIASQVWVGLNCPLALLWWLILIPYITKFKPRDLLEESDVKFYAEVLMLVTVYTTILLKIFLHL